MRNGTKHKGKTLLVTYYPGCR